MNANEERLLEGLKILAASETRMPSPELEHRLRRQMRSRRPLAFRLAVAALLAASFTIVLIPQPTHPVPRLEPPPRTPVRPFATAERPPTTPVPRTVAHHRRVRHPLQSATLMGIPYSGSIAQLDRAELVRVSMPGAQLIAWGYPIPGSDPNEMVDADLLIGEDGLARAFRLVP